MDWKRYKPLSVMVTNEKYSLFHEKNVVHNVISNVHWDRQHYSSKYQILQCIVTVGNYILCCQIFSYHHYCAEMCIELHCCALKRLLCSNVHVNALSKKNENFFMHTYAWICQSVLVLIRYEQRKTWQDNKCLHYSMHACWIILILTKHGYTLHRYIYSY